MLVEAAGRSMIPIAIVLASSLLLLILKLVFGSIKAGIYSSAGRPNSDFRSLYCPVLDHPLARSRHPRVSGFRLTS